MSTATASAPTRERILDAAERLFAQHGFTGTSLRRIVSEAEVNLAAVNYHFGSKEALLRAVVARLVEPTNAARLARLDAVEAAAGVAPALEAVLDAFIAPVVRRAHELGPRAGILGILFGRSGHDSPGVVRGILREQFQVVRDRFLDALERALPGEPREHLAWKLHATIGAMSFCATNPGTNALLPPLFDPDDHDRSIERLVSFAVSGFRAPFAAPAVEGRP